MGVRITVQSLWAKTNASTFVYEFAQSRIVIGRARSADVQLPHRAVSAIHASIRTEGVGYVLVDEGSTNGTRINEVLLPPGRSKVLRKMDTVDLGGYRLIVDVGVAVTEPISARTSMEYARRMLAEQMTDDVDHGLEEELIRAQTGADQRVELLPIAKELPSEPPPPRESRPSRQRISKPTEQPSRPATKLGRSEVAVYALAAIVVVMSVLAMTLLMQG